LGLSDREVIRGYSGKDRLVYADSPDFVGLFSAVAGPCRFKCVHARGSWSEQGDRGCYDSGWHRGLSRQELVANWMGEIDSPRCEGEVVLLTGAARP
jgi:hypothetical protein